MYQTRFVNMIEENYVLQYYLSVWGSNAVLNIAEAEPWSDGGWTKVASKFKETPLATNRQATESPHDNEQCEDMKVNHHKAT